MTIGSIVHELLQIVLQRKLTTLAQIRDVVEEMLMSQQMAFTLYASQMTAAEAYDEVKKFEDKILEFVEKYLIGNNVLNGNKVNYSHQITIIFVLVLINCHCPGWFI